MPFDERPAFFIPQHEIRSTVSGGSACDFLCRRLRGVRRNLFRMALNLLNGGGDFVHILLVAEQGELRNPYGLPCCPLRVRKRLIEESVLLRGLRAAQALAICPGAEAI